MTQNQLKELIREEYHNVKSFMEEKYGFVPELGQVVDNPYVSAFKVEDYLETSVNEGKFYITRNLGRGQGKALVGGWDLKRNKKLPPKEFKTYKDAEKEVKRLYDMSKGIPGGGPAYMVTDKDMNLLKPDGKKMFEGGDDSEMAVSQLNRSLDYARMLIDKLRGKGDLDAWVQSYITKAEDYLNTTFDYYKGKEGEIEEYDVENEQDIKEFIQFMKEYKEDINEAEYQGRDVKLNKIMQGDVKKFKVYVKNPKGNVVKVNFGHGGSSAKGKTMKIKKSNPERRKSFRARHNCDNPGPRHKARYWACRTW